MGLHRRLQRLPGGGVHQRLQRQQPVGRFLAPDGEVAHWRHRHRQLGRDAQIVFTRPGDGCARVVHHHLGLVRRLHRGLTGFAFPDKRQHRVGVATAHGDLGAGMGCQLLERKETNRLEQPVTCRVAAPDDEQRAVGQRRQVVDEVPACCGVVAHQFDGQFEREGAAEHPEHT